MRLPVVAVIVLTGFLIGCASPQPRANARTKNICARWERGDFSVAFHGGPRTAEGKCFSYYTISRKDLLSGMEDPIIVVESAQDIDPNADRLLPDFAKIYISKSGRTLLIEDRVLMDHDGGPCIDYILVNSDRLNRHLSYDYLDLPTKFSTRPDIDGPIRVPPQITNLTDAEISFRYPDHLAKTQIFKKLIKPERRPSTPG